MEMNTYQSEAESTAIYPGQGDDSGITYCVLGLTGEAGELANKWKKYFRDGMEIADIVKLMRDELGDVLWYLANAASEIGYSLDEIAEANIEKLQNRQSNSTLHGAGDNR